MFSNGDQVNGAGGSDSLDLFFGTDNNANVQAGDTIVLRTTAVEAINIELDLGGDLTVDMSGSTGVESVSNTGGDAGDLLTYEQLQQNTTIRILDSEADIRAEFDNNVLDGDGNLMIEVDNAGNSDVGGTASTITVATSGSESFTSATINTIGEDSRILIDTAATGDVDLETLTITGGAAAFITSDQVAFNDLATIDATANTGGVVIDVIGNDQDVTFTGGSGTNIIQFGFTEYDEEDSVTGGASLFDAISIDSDSTEELDDAVLDSVETVIVRANAIAAVTIDAEDKDFTNVIVTDNLNQALSLHNFDAVTLYLEEDQAGLIEFSDTDVANIVISDSVNLTEVYEQVISDDTGLVTLANVDLTGVEDATFSVPDQADSLTITQLTLGDTETLAFAGDGDVAIAALTDAAEDLETLDLSALTGSFDSTATDLNNEGVKVLFGDVDDGETQEVSLNAVADADDTDILTFAADLDGDIEISNFEEGVGGDILNFSALVDGFADLDFEDNGGNVIITSDEFDGSITLIGVSQVDLDGSSNFQFA